MSGRLGKEPELAELPNSEETRVSRTCIALRLTAEKLQHILHQTSLFRLLAQGLDFECTWDRRVGDASGVQACADNIQSKALKVSGLEVWGVYDLVFGLRFRKIPCPPL